MTGVHLKVSGPLDELSVVLWRERDLLGTLLFKLETERLVVDAARSRWLARAAHEVESVLDELRRTEILRSATADAVATAARLETNPALRELAQSTREPWRTILTDHREAFLGLTREIRDAVDTGRASVAAGHRSGRLMPPSLSDFLR